MAAHARVGLLGVDVSSHSGDVNLKRLSLAAEESEEGYRRFLHRLRSDSFPTSTVKVAENGR
jgi:hypothetical protein